MANNFPSRSLIEVNVLQENRKLAFVTGGSSGIGLELAKQFASHGFDIAITSSSDRVYDAAEALRALGVNAYAFKADAATYEGVEGFWQFMLSLNRKIDAAALHVGISKGGAFVDNHLEAEFRLIAVNVTGLVHLAKRVATHMVANGDGRILITASVAATSPTPYDTTYGPSRAFAFNFATTLREELRDSGVKVTAFLPGATDSDFHKNAGMANTIIGRSVKNDRRLVGKQGFDGLMNDLDIVVGGDEATQARYVENRSLDESFKAARHAAKARPS